MVHKIIWLLIVPFTSQAAMPGLHLRWMGSQDKACQKLVEVFLVELRSMAADRIIELEAIQTLPPENTSLKQIEIRCTGNAVEVRDGQNKTLLHYLAKAAGFDANDWLPFQQEYLRPDLSLPKAQNESASQPTQSASPLLETNGPEINAEHHSLFQRWWFWALVGGVGASVYGIVRATENHSDRVNVEIH